MSEKDNEKYTIDNAKNDIQNLQSQNLFDFQEIKRLDSLIKDYDKRILQAINFNNQINKKIQSQISLLIDKIKYLEDNSSSSIESGLTITQTNQLNEAYRHSQSYHVSKQEIQTLNDEIQTQISLILDRIKNLEDNLSSTPIVLCKNAGLASADGQETQSTTRIATDFIPVTIEGELTILSMTTENYKYLIRYYDINKEFIGIAGGEWILDGNPTVFKPRDDVNFENVKFLRLVYKSKNNDNEVINTIKGIIELEEDGNVRMLQMQYEGDTL